MKRFLSILLYCSLLIEMMVPAMSATGTTTTASQTHTTDIAVMSYNALNQPGVIENWAEYYTYNTRMERLVEIISRDDYDADSIGFQEVNYNIRNALGVMLKDYTLAPNIEQSSNGIYYRTDRMEVLESATFWLSETPDYPSKYSGATEERTGTYAVLKNKLTGVTYIHVNTHLDYVSTEVLCFQMRVVREKIEELREKYPGIGIVATGDYNMTRTNDAYNVMISEWINVNMQDSLFCADEVINEGATMINGDLIIEDDLSAYDDTLAIDHLFASIDVLDVVSYKVMREGDKDNPRIAASDHFGLYVELNLGNGSIKRETPETEILIAYDSPEIDGVMDDAYAASNGGTANNLITYNSLLESDMITSADYVYLYDENYLYYYIDVKDAVVTDADMHTHDYCSDGIELYYNFVKSTSAPNDYAGADGEAGYFHLYSDGYVESNFPGEYTAVMTSTGYAIEGKIPLTQTVKTLITSGERVQIGVAFFINDDADNGTNGERDYLVPTDSEVLGAWSNPNAAMSVYLLPNANAQKTSPYGVVIMDAEKDSAYSSAFGTISTEVLCDGGTAIPAIDKTSAKWWTAHDQDNLFYYIEVTDAYVTDADIPSYLDSTGARTVDCIEIYYNFAKGSTNPTDYGSANGEAGYFTVFANGTDFIGADSCSNYVAKHTDTGYVIEGFIPLSAAAKDLLDGDCNTQIGLSFLIHDDTDNGTGGRDYLAWNDPDVLAAWNNPSMTATLCLEPTPETLGLAPYGAVELDGELDTTYFNYKPNYVDKCVFGPTSEDVVLPDNELTFMKYYVAHDRNFVYLYLDVTDYHVTDASTQTTQYYEVDGVQIYYNYAKGTTNPTSWGGESGYFTVSANGANVVGSDAVAIGTTYVAKYTDTGYVIELAMPLTTEARIQLESDNLTIGLAFSVNDDADNGGGTRDYIIAHDVDGGYTSFSSWVGPQHTSEVTLMKNQVSGEIATTGTVTVDGEKDHVYHLSTIGKIDNVIIKTNPILPEVEETTATYTFARDNEYLYYYIDVTDSVVTPADITNFSDGNGGYSVDCVQIYYNFVKDINTTASWDEVASEAGYFTVFANGTDYVGAASCSTYAAKHTDTGYVIEGRVPLSNTVKAALQAGENVCIGVGFQVSDDANNGETVMIGDTFCGRDYVVVSNSDVLSAWSSPANINTMILLEGNGTLPESGGGEDEDTDVEEGNKTEFNVILPNVDGLTITTDKETYKEGERVTLDIRLDEGYEFVQDAGMYDFGHWSNSSQKWKYFVSCVHGWYMMGRCLKADGQTLIWSGNTFLMPNHDVEIIADVEMIDTAVAQKNTVTLDGMKDAAYDASTAVEVNRLNESKTYYSAENPAHAYGTVTATYDNNYLYIFAEVTDPTKTTVEMLSKDVSSTTDLSLVGMDGITFYFDFLNTDTENIASNEYGFVEGESGLFVIDSLGLKTSNSGAVYNKLSNGFASYNGNTDKADYVVVGTDAGYNVELKIALSDSVKVKLAAADAGDEIKIGFGAMIMDDIHNNGGFDYENGDVLVCNASLVANLWQATICAHDADRNLSVTCYASPRWMSSIILVAGEDECEQ